MQTVLLVVHLMIAAAMIGVVLMQQSEGGALGIGGGGGGGGGFMTGRGTANTLTRMTAMLAAAFFMTSILLTIFAQSDKTSSAFDAAAPNSAVTKTTTDGDAKPDDKTKTNAGGGVLDALKAGEGRAPLPSVPQTP